MFIPKFFIPLLIYSFCFVTNIQAQKGDMFPVMETESLAKDKMMLPKDIKGKYTLIGLAFSKKSEEYLKTWYTPVYNQFIKKSESKSIFDFSYDIYSYFIPMFSGIKKAAYNSVMNKMKKSVDGQLYQHIFFYKGEIATYKEKLKIGKKDVPYFFVLNPNGNIVYSTKGKYSDSKMREIVEALQSSLELK